MAKGWLGKKQSSTEWTGFLEEGVKVEGRLESTGTFRIDSAMKGTLVSEDTLILGERAVVEGHILGNHVTIAGRFDGEIRARGRVEIKPDAVVTGEIHTPCLIIEPGAVFNGKCHMLASPAPEAASPVMIPIRSAGSQQQAQTLSEPAPN
jgi:cytoskeletal protein CcmA (bactofilin family)